MVSFYGTIIELGMNRVENVVLEKSKKFSVRIVRLSQYLEKEKREYDLSRQIKRSGTSIGANIREATYAQSKNDFISKMNIALKEAAETEYWIELLKETGYLTKEQYESIVSDCKELVKLLTTIVRTSKERN